MSATTVTGDADLSSAGHIRTWTSVTWCSTPVTTVSRSRTGLSALVSAGSGVTDARTLMLTTGQCLATRSATRNSLHQTRDVAPRLVTTVAQLGGEGGAGGTLDITVAGVQDWVVTGVRSGAGLGAVRRSGATWYWRIHHTGSTLTPQLIKADIVACLAVARVTQVLTMVEFAAQQPVTDLSAGVLHSDTTHFSTLVSSTHPEHGNIDKV